MVEANRTVPYIFDLQGNVIVRNDLPPAGFSRWLTNEKYTVAKAVEAGILRFDEAVARYQMTVAELNEWIAAAKSGFKHCSPTLHLAGSYEEVVKHLDELTPQPRVFVHGKLTLTVDYPRACILVNGQEVQMRLIRWRFLKLLALNAGTVVSKRSFIRLIKGRAQHKLIDVHICHIRNQLKVDKEETDADSLIKTVWGRGYVIPSTA